MKHITSFVFIGLTFILSTQVSGQVFSVTDYGAEPNSRKNCVEAIYKTLEAAKGTEGATIHFPQGRYDFYPTTDGKRVALPINGLKNLVVDGGAGDFVFHGIMSVADVNGSENVTLKNFSVDWDRPLIVQGAILDTTDDHVDIKFDKTEYPFEIEDGKIFFNVDEGRRAIDGYTLLFDQTMKELVYTTRDNTLGNNDLFNTKSEELENGVVRFHGKPKYKAESGTIIALWLGRYVRVAFSLNHSKNVVLQDINVYHSLSHSVVGFRTENITLSNVVSVHGV